MYSNLTKARLDRDLHPYFVTGFADGESTFYLGISKSSRYKIGWTVTTSFSMELYEKDLDLLKSIKSFFSIGNIRVRARDNQLIYSVSSIKDIKEVLIPHFEKYPLVTQKQADFELFKLAIDIIDNEKHLTLEGLNQLAAIKVSMNKGLSDLLSS